MAGNTEDTLERIAGSLDLIVKLALMQVRGDKNQTEMILLLDKLGCTSG